MAADDGSADEDLVQFDQSVGGTQSEQAASMEMSSDAPGALDDFKPVRTIACTATATASLGGADT